jgi:serine/threonine protein phosphatase PrpC
MDKKRAKSPDDIFDTASVKRSKISDDMFDLAPPASKKVSAYQNELDDVERLLLANPQDETLLSLRADLLMLAQLESNDGAENVQEKSQDHRGHWRIGDRCKALFETDGCFYPAVITSFLDSLRCEVRFLQNQYASEPPLSLSLQSLIAWEPPQISALQPQQLVWAPWDDGYLYLAKVRAVDAASHASRVEVSFILDGACRKVAVAEILLADPESSYDSEVGQARSSTCGLRGLASATSAGHISHEPKAGGNQDSVLSVLDAAGPHAHLYGVMDGHGDNGHLVSGWLRAQFPNALLMHKHKLKKSPRAVLELTCTTVTERLALLSAEFKAGQTKKRFDCTFSGSTAVVALEHKGSLHVANVGDSRVVLARALTGVNDSGSAHSRDSTRPSTFDNDPSDADRVPSATAADPTAAYLTLHKITPLALSRDHKPGDAAERARIERAGGRVAQVAPGVGPLRAMARGGTGTGLAVARAFGDDWATPIGVVSAPEMTTHVLVPADLFAVFGSDGLWDHLSNGDVVAFVHAKLIDQGLLREEKGAAGSSCPMDRQACELRLQRVAEALVKEAEKRWAAHDGGNYQDDITALIALFRL